MSGGNRCCVTVAITLPPCPVLRLPEHLTRPSPPSLEGEGREAMPHPTRGEWGELLCPAQRRGSSWEREHGAKGKLEQAGTAAEPGSCCGPWGQEHWERAPCTGPLLAWHSQQRGVLGPVLVAAPKKSNPTIRNHFTSWTGGTGLSPRAPGRAQEGTEGQVGTPMAAHPKIHPHSLVCHPGAASLWHRDCRAHSGDTLGLSPPSPCQNQRKSSPKVPSTLSSGPAVAGGFSGHKAPGAPPPPRVRPWAAGRPRWLPPDPPRQ